MKTIIFLLLISPFFINAQSSWNKSKKKNSYGKGTIFLYWGYNRSGYTKNNMRFVGPGYDFTMDGVTAYDNPEKFDPKVYFNPSQLTIPQFNARVGFYFKNHWAISIGYDHMKYLFADNNQVTLSGTVDPGIDLVTNLSGTYNATPYVTEREKFHYENSDGLNYIRFELTRTDHLAEVGKNKWFILSSNIGVSAGGLLSFNDFDFAGQKDMRTISMSGYGISTHLGLRFEFFRHFFVQSAFGAGFMHQVKVRNRPNDSSAYTRHAYGFIESNVVFGALFYIKTKNACDSCPVW